MEKALKSMLFVGLLLNASSVFSQSLVEQIKARAGEITELKALLNNADSAVRIAAIDVMQNSDDVAMREMGFSAGLNSSDEAVVALTIRNKFKEIKNFSLQLSVNSDASEETKKQLIDLGRQVSFSLGKYDSETATFTASPSFYNGNSTSSISGRVIHLTAAYSNGTLVLNDELFFEGEFTYNKQTFAATVQLF
jgi:hypothetical protein